MVYLIYLSEYNIKIQKSSLKLEEQQITQIVLHAIEMQPTTDLQNLTLPNENDNATNM